MCDGHHAGARSARTWSAGRSEAIAAGIPFPETRRSAPPDSRIGPTRVEVTANIPADALPQRIDSRPASGAPAARPLNLRGYRECVCITAHLVRARQLTAGYSATAAIVHRAARRRRAPCRDPCSSNCVGCIARMRLFQSHGNGTPQRRADTFPSTRCIASYGDDRKCLPPYGARTPGRSPRAPC